MSKQSVTIPNHSPNFTIYLNNVIEYDSVQFESLIEWIFRTTLKSSTTYFDNYRDFFHSSQYSNGKNSKFVSSIEFLYIDEDQFSIRIIWDNEQEAILIGQL